MDDFSQKYLQNKHIRKQSNESIYTQYITVFWNYIHGPLKSSS